MRIRRLVVTVLLLAVPAAPALADHTHVMATGNGQCVVLASGGGEGQVQLPHADQFPENRRHPLHLKVHLGEPGTRQGEAVVWVSDTPDAGANCDGYVND